MSTNPRTVHRILVISLFTSLAMLATMWLFSQREALPMVLAVQHSATQRPEHAGGEDHEKKEAELHKTMSGTVDIYYELDEIAASKPTLSGVTFAGLVDVTGKE